MKVNFGFVKMLISKEDILLPRETLSKILNEIIRDRKLSYLFIVSTPNRRVSKYKPAARDQKHTTQIKYKMRDRKRERARIFGQEQKYIEKKITGKSWSKGAGRRFFKDFKRMSDWIELVKWNEF